MKNIILSSSLFICIASETFAGKDLAIMLDVNKESHIITMSRLDL